MILIPIAVMVAGLSLVGFIQIRSVSIGSAADEKEIKTLILLKRIGIALGLVAVVIARVLNV